MFPPNLLSSPTFSTADATIPTHTPVECLSIEEVRDRQAHQVSFPLLAHTSRGKDEEEQGKGKGEGDKKNLQYTGGTNAIKIHDLRPDL